MNRACAKFPSRAEKSFPPRRFAVAYTYDDADRLLTETQQPAGQAAQTLAYAYDNDGRRLGLQYPSTYTLAYLYNGRGQLGSISTPDSPPPVVAYGYDAAGRRTVKTLQNGNYAAYGYDNANRLTGIAWVHAGGTGYASQAYVNDADGRRTSMTRESGAAENYGYDATSQLTGANYSDTGITTGYNYDAMGNLLSRSGFLGTNNDSFTPNLLNQYASINGSGMVHDMKGNLTASSYALSPSIYAYDAQNRLTGVTNAVSSGAFGYDGLNRCVRRTINSVTTYNYYDGWSLIEERDASGGLQASYIHGADMDEEVCRTTWTGSTATRLYYEADALNSVQRLTDTGGNIVEQYRYDAFGLPSVYDASFTPLTASAVGNRFLFQGREWFAEFQITDHRNRYYSPLLQRWLNRDPIEERGGMNLYTSCKNSTVNYRDPSGNKIATSVAEWVGKVLIPAVWLKIQLSPMYIERNHDVCCPKGSGRYLLAQRKSETTRTIGINVFDGVDKVLNKDLTITTSVFVENTWGCCKKQGWLTANTNPWDRPPDKLLPNTPLPTPFSLSDFNISTPGGISVEFSASQGGIEKNASRTCVEAVVPTSSYDDAPIISGGGGGRF